MQSLVSCVGSTRAINQTLLVCCESSPQQSSKLRHSSGSGHRAWNSSNCWSIQARQYQWSSRPCRQQIQTRSGTVTDSYQTDISIIMSTNSLLIQAKIEAPVSCFTAFQTCGEFHAHLGCAAAGYIIATETSCSTPLGTAGDIKLLH